MPHQRRIPTPRNAYKKILATWLKRWRAWLNKHPRPKPPAPPKPKPKPRPHVTMHMYDDVTVSLMPKDAEAVAGYVGGRWRTYPAVVTGWPHAKHMSIAVAADEDADCLDIERLDATNAQAAVWVRRQQKRGVPNLPKPCVYTYLANAQALVVTLGKAGVKRSEYLLGTAHYTGIPHLCDVHCGLGFTARADTTQYTDRALGKSLDEWLCSPGFFK
jgi:hypothetical protein